jgi:GNAT superfamily N-acetyltransferase
MKALIQTGSSLSACGHAQAGGRVPVPLKSDFLSIIARQIATEGYEYYLAPGAGYFALVPDRAAGRVLLSKIYVREDRRGTGLGRAMVAQAEARCAELGCRELWLTVNKHNVGSIAFYERLGFRKTGAVVTDIGHGFVMDDWRMAKRCRYASERFRRRSTR